jgi:hypothetical protein
MNAPLPATSPSRAFYDKLHPTLTQSGRRIWLKGPHFSSLDSAVTGLHCIASMNAGSALSNCLVLLVFLSACSIFLGARPGKARLTYPARIFPGNSTNNIYANSQNRSQKRSLNETLQPDDTLAKIVGSKPLPRSEVTKKIWDYIKKNKLQDAKKKTLINADDALKAVFGGKKQVTMFEMTKRFRAVK